MAITIGQCIQIVRQHETYLRSGAFECGDFAPEFADYLRQNVPDLRCTTAAIAAKKHPQPAPLNRLSVKDSERSGKPGLAVVRSPGFV